MVTAGLLARLEAKPGKEPDVEAFLQSALSIVQEEATTTAWFALRFGRGGYGIFDVFPDDQGRQAHLDGEVAKALGERREELFSVTPRIERVEVLSDKLPAEAAPPAVTKGVLLGLRAKAGREPDLESFLGEGRTVVEGEPDTVAWFALRFEDGRHGIFDVFPDGSGRTRHLTGRIPRALATKGFSLLGGLPKLEMLDVEAHKLPTR